MNEQTIPAEKVRELVRAYSEYENPQSLLQALQSLLPPPPQPTTGFLGRWAKHPEYGDVVCVTDSGWGNAVKIAWRTDDADVGTDYAVVRIDSLTFPEQVTRPEEVQPGEAWRIRDTEGNEFNAVKTSSGYYTTDRSGYTWLFCDHDGNGHWLKDKEATLVCPLTPERPVSDLQAKYDELDKNWCYLDTKYSALRKDYDELDNEYRDAQERIKTLEQASTPRTVTTEAEYAALPAGSIVLIPQAFPWTKDDDSMWKSSLLGPARNDAEMSEHNGSRTVLRYGWGDEQPTWRIEHDWRNLRVGEYIIDQSGDDGTVTKKDEKHGWWLTDSMALGNQTEAPFIAFLNRDAATPEAIEEAKRARDKEMDK